MLLTLDVGTPFSETHRRGEVQAGPLAHGGGGDRKLSTSGIFLTNVGRPESKTKLRKMKEDFG